MQQVTPGIFHWTALNENINTRVSSYYVADAAAAIDPKVPDEGLDTLPGPVARVLLSSGHHLRDARAFADALGVEIFASTQAVEHLGADATGVQAWGAGTPEVAPGITAIHIGVIAEDESALFVDHGDGALAIADAVNHTGDGLAFFPDALLGEDPDAVKQGLKAALRALVDAYEFDALLFAHGEPLASGGHEALREFADR